MKRKRKHNINSKSLLIVAAIILINFISIYFFFRIDLTADQRYSLSKATKDILRDLDGTVTVKAYFTEDVPPQIAKLKDDFKDMLIEYSSVSGGNLVYEFINPNASEEDEQKAMENGIRPMIINARERDQVTQKKVYLGAVLNLGEEKDIIPVIANESSMEYDLSSSIKKLSVAEKPKVAFIQGQGESPVSEMGQAMQQLNILYEIVPVDINDPMVNLSEFKTIAIIAPKDTFNIQQLNLLDQFLANGGNIFIALNRVETDMTQGTAMAIDIELEKWLAQKGINVLGAFLIDASCGNVNVRQQQMGFTFNTAVPFPYIPIITNFGDHPISKGLEQVIMAFASPITYSGDTSLRYTPIATTSNKSGFQIPPFMFDVQKKWQDDDFNNPNQVVAAVLSGKIVGDNESNIIIVGDGNFLVNGSGQQAQQIQPDNVSLMVNSIDWLTDKTGLIDLRTKQVTSRPLDQVSDGKKTFLRWFNFIIPLLLITFYGITRYQRRRIIRKRRMEEGYV